jgi:PTS system beta-glucosides-specific IIC component
VKKGTKLVTFDIEGIQKEGYRTTTPVIVTNTDQYLDVVPSTFKHVNSKEPVFTVIK